MRTTISIKHLIKIQFWLFVKHPLNLFLLLVFLTAGLYGLYQGFAFKAKEVRTIDAFRLEKEQALRELTKGFEADTTTAEGKADYNKVTALNTANWYTILPAYKAPNTTAIYAIGQADIFPHYYTVKLESFFMQLFKQNEIANPLRSLAGHFDTSFWIIYLLPLLIVVLGFNALSSELDNGNWRLIRSQGVTTAKWVRSKIILIALWVEAFFMAVFVTGVLVNYFFFDQGPATTDAAFFVVANLYLCFWLAAMYLINAFALSTRASALYSGVLWIMICIVIPTLVTTIVEKSVVVDNTTVSRMSRRPQDTRLDDNTFALTLIRKFGVLRPKYKDATVSPANKWFGFAKYFAYHELLDDTNRVAVETYYQDIEHRQRINNASVVVNPAAATDGIFASLAFNDAEANHSFVWEVNAFHQRMHDALFPPVFYEKVFTAADYGRLPEFERATSHPVSGMAVINPLILLAMITLLARWANRKLINVPSVR